MAIQTLQLGVVLAIGFSLAAASLNAVAIETSPTIQPALHLEDPGDVAVARGHGATLRCGATSPRHDHQVRWLLNGTLLPEGDSRWRTYRNGTLNVPKVAGKRVNSTLEGSYRCLARNGDGALLSNPARLRIASLKEFVKQPEDINVTDSQPVVIPCSINSFPKAVVAWERNNLPLPQNSRYVPLPTGSLLITSIHSSDVGSYRCKAVNTILKKMKVSSPGTVDVYSPRDPAVVVPPTILPIDIDFNVTMLVGNDVALYCVVNGSPRPTIRWLNDMNIVIGNAMVLRLKNVTVDASGRYTCSAHNSGGRVSQRYFLSVQQAPYFNVTPASKVYPTAKTIRLDCQALGFPEPKIFWYKDGEPFHTNNTFGRAYEQASGLLIRYSVPSDAGVYQCIAENSVGTVWVAATVKLTYSPNSPGAPLEVHCQSYNDTSVCLKWSAVPNAQAYSVLAYHSAVRSRDYVTNETFKMADNLLPNTNYTFSVRTYSNEASNEFVHVTCETGSAGSRNLSVELQGENSVKLTWTEINTDNNPCTVNLPIDYRVQWRKVNQTSSNIKNVTGLQFVIIGLQQGTSYEFQVVTPNDSTGWVQFALPKSDNLTYPSENNLDSSFSNETIIVPATPSFLEAMATSMRSVNLTWSESEMSNVYYTICYVATMENKGCESGKLLKSFTNQIEIGHLKPKTEYEIKVQTHSNNGLHSEFSHSLQITTPSDVPTSVQSLKYKIINATSACIRWDPPLYKNGLLTGYLIKYTPNDSWPLEQWLSMNVSLSQKDKGCWAVEALHTLSAPLQNLDPSKHYMVIVIATNDAGLGNPTVPITISTMFPVGRDRYQPPLEDKLPPVRDDIFYKQGIGVVLGLVISILTMGTFVGCVLLRRRYLKVRRMTRGRQEIANNHCPNGQLGSAMCFNGQEHCRPDAHEMQQLVEGNGSIYVPTHLDTKGGSEFPNGQINGNARELWLNGNLLNSHVRITENPQYFTGDGERARLSANCEELKRFNSSGEPDSYEEDSNSNLQKLCLSKLLGGHERNGSPILNHGNRYNLDRNNLKFDDYGSSVDSNLDSSLDRTQLTTIDDLIIPPGDYVTVSPIVGPNG